MRGGSTRTSSAQASLFPSDVTRVGAGGRQERSITPAHWRLDTLINRLIGHATFDTKAVSGTGAGTHATARRQLIVLEQGAMLIDTPGMRELGLLDATEGVDQSFEDIGALSANCRYADCSHTQEPGCAVLPAIAKGALPEERYHSYLKLKKESEYHAMRKMRRTRVIGDPCQVATLRLSRNVSSSTGRTALSLARPAAFLDRMISSRPITRTGQPKILSSTAWAVMAT